MTAPEDPTDEAFRRLDDRIGALEASQVRKPLSFDAGGPGAAYRLVAELVGGVLAGLGFGWLLDRYLHTSPFGLIGGVLVGAGLGVVLVVRSASAMSDASRGSGPDRRD
jgi:ATP synthase protein I